MQQDMLTEIAPDDYERMAIFVESFDPFYDPSLSRKCKRKLLLFRRECITRIAEMRIQGTLADQMDAEADEMRLRADQLDDEIDVDGILTVARYARAVYLNEQARFARARSEQAKMELRFYFEGFFHKDEDESDEE